MVNTKGLTKAEVFAALYNAAHAQGLGILQYEPFDMSIKEAEKVTASCDDFDYFKGRVMKVRLSDPEGFDERLYDRDNGNGAAQRAISNAFKRKEQQDK